MAPPAECPGITESVGDACDRVLSSRLCNCRCWLPSVPNTRLLRPRGSSVAFWIHTCRRCSSNCPNQSCTYHSCQPPCTRQPHPRGRSTLAIFSACTVADFRQGSFRCLHKCCTIHCRRSSTVAHRTIPPHEPFPPFQETGTPPFGLLSSSFYSLLIFITLPFSSSSSEPRSRLSLYMRNSLPVARSNTDVTKPSALIGTADSTCW